MNSTLSSILIFAAGASLGSLVTWKVLKTKYEKIAQEEIDSIKERFSNRTALYAGEQQSNSKPVREDDTYDRITLDYRSSSDISKDNKKKRGEVVAEPYVITPDEFGELDDYETANLTYYADGILTDDMDNLVEDIEGTVGAGSLSHIGDYEPDAVHVRNDALKCDYEILVDVRKFADVVSDRFNLGNSEV